MKARIGSYCGGKPIWHIESNSNVYVVYDGRYTAARFIKGRRDSFTIMHERFAKLRARIDAAIAAAESK